MSSNSKPTTSCPSLKTHLLSSLKSTESKEKLHLTCLSSKPRRTSTLFPYSTNVPKCFEKEYFITLATDISAPSTPSGGLEGHLPIDGNKDAMVDPSKGQDDGEDTAKESEPGPRQVLIVALHAYLYTIPSSSTSIIYISKVDTSGQSSQSFTHGLISSFFTYFLIYRPTPIVDITLFARSQAQYLFPNSGLVEGKRVSGGLKLCSWWKGVFELAVERYLSVGGQETGEKGEKGEEGKEGEKGELGLRYLLPSYSDTEALGMLGRPRRLLPRGLKWEYGYPFPSNLFSGVQNDDRAKEFTEGIDDSIGHCLAWSVPALPDDPKTRFMEELVFEALPHLASDQDKTRKETKADRANDQADDVSPKRGEEIPSSTGGGGTDLKEKDKIVKDRERNRAERKESDRRRAQLVLSRTSVKEFWERMGFRQECMSGDVTGFFHLVSRVDSGVDLSSHSAENGSGVAVGMETTGDKTGPAEKVNTMGAKAHSNQDQSPSSSLTKEIVPDVPNRGNVPNRGFSKRQFKKTDSTTTLAEEGSTSSSLIIHKSDLSIGLIDRIHQSLLNTDFGDGKGAVEGTRIWNASTRAIVLDEIGEAGWNDVYGCFVPNPSIHVNGPSVGGKRKEEVVTVLKPRKKVTKAGQATR